MPDDARARVQLAIDYEASKRMDDAAREVQFALALRPNDANVLYNVACVYCAMNKPDDALSALKKSWSLGIATPSGHVAILTSPCSTAIRTSNNSTSTQPRALVLQKHHSVDDRYKPVKRAVAPIWPAGCDLQEVRPGLA